MSSSDADATPLQAFYAYSPSFTLPVVVACLFLGLLMAHLVLLARTRAYYLIPFVLGVAGEVAGYGCRRWSVMHPFGRVDGLLPYLCQTLFIILSPALMAASFYMIFGRLIRYVGESYSPVRAGRVTAIFVVFDVLSFLVQGGGGSLSTSSSPGVFALAKTILLIGFLIQIISFGLFGVCAFIYQRRAIRAGIPSGEWTSILTTLYIGCVLILIRSIFRTIEFSNGSQSNTGYLLTHEAFYYGLETLPVFLCSVLFVIRHPSKYIPELNDPNARINELPIGTHGSRGVYPPYSNKY